MAIPQPAKFISDFEQLGFGMFIHFGLYSQMKQGEWIFHQTDDLTMEEYAKLKDTFTAEDFDAEDIVRTAHDAGCRYICLTTRHHEGFSLYDTRGLSDFDAPHSPAHRDLIKEFTDACRKYDIVPFFYHTSLDWYQKDFDENWEKYLEYLRASVEVLCRNYGPVGGFWFDGHWSKPEADWHDDRLYGTIRRYQPNAMIINNSGVNMLGAVGNNEIDAVTFEQGRPTPMNREGADKYRAAEMCETMNGHWGYNENDVNYKSPRTLIENLCACRKVGANYLLNIGPTEQGGIDPVQRQYLSLIGKWMKVYGEAIYNGRPYVYDNGGDDFVMKSADGKYLYFFCFHPGEEGNENVTVDVAGNRLNVFRGVKDKVRSICWMDNGQPLEYTQNGDEFSVRFNGFPYRYNYAVRVAKAEIE